MDTMQSGEEHPQEQYWMLELCSGFGRMLGTNHLHSVIRNSVLNYVKVTKLGSNLLTLIGTCRKKSLSAPKEE